MTRAMHQPVLGNDFAPVVVMCRARVTPAIGRLALFNVRRGCDNSVSEHCCNDLFTIHGIHGFVLVTVKHNRRHRSLWPRLR